MKEIKLSAVYLAILLSGISGGCASTKEIKEPIAITEKVVVEKIKPILYVFHDEEGDWLFLSSEDTKMAEVFTMPLREMFDFDDRLRELADLPIGWRAIRSESNKEWERVNPKEKKRFRNN